jgi:hypothetical protein
VVIEGKRTMATQNQLPPMTNVTMSVAATIAPVVLWSSKCHGNLYLAGKNTFLEFYTDENKATKRSAFARSLSADSHFTGSYRSTQSTATPTNRSSSSSNRSEPSSDNEVAPNAFLQSPGASPRAYQHQSNDASPLASGTWHGGRVPQVTAVNGYPMETTQMSEIHLTRPRINGGQKEPQKKNKLNNAKIDATSPTSPGKFAKKQDLKKLNAKAPVSQEEVTTLMIRGIPCSFSQEALISIIDEAGLNQKYNFFYLPRAGNNSSNLGYAFINFVDRESAAHCMATFNGIPLDPERSMKTCTISPADIQGLPMLWKHFRRTAVSRGSRGPMFLKV